MSSVSSSILPALSNDPRLFIQRFRCYLPSIALALTAASVVPAHGAVAVYDLTAQWSDVSNPNGVWSYNSGSGPLPSVIRASDPWTTPQKSWGDLPGWFRSNGTEQFAHDWQAGDVITHTGTSVIKWTAPIDGLAAVTGAVWPMRDIGRFNRWDILLNGTSLTSGVIGDGDPYSRSAPFNLANGSGGPGAISSISVKTGDTIELQLDRFNSNFGDYAGVKLTITIPEPQAVVAMLIGLGLFCLVFTGKDYFRTGEGVR